MTTIIIRAFGRPAPQGSKTRGAAGQLREVSNYLPAWRTAVKRAALRTLLDAGVRPEDRPVFPAGTAVHLRELIFLLAPGQQPAAAPDIEKLVRAVFDPITDAKVWADDGQVKSMNEVDEIAHTEHGEAPGAIIILSDSRHEIVNNPYSRESALMSDYDRYRITVEGITDVPAFTDDPETAGTGKQRVTRLLYVEGPAGIVLPVIPAIGQAIGQPLASASVRVDQDETPAGNHGAGQPARRTRRTKAQIEADNARESAAGNGAVPTTAEPGMPPVDVTVTGAAPYNPFMNK